MKNQKLLNSLAVFFLNFRDPDVSFFKLLRVLRRLNSNMEKNITVNDVQKTAYRCEEGLKNG